MANKHIKRCSRSLVAKEMQVKIKMRHDYMLTEMNKEKCLSTQNDGKYIGQLEWYNHSGKVAIS